MIFFTRYGITTICPSCGNKIWINIDWPGLPKWKIPDIGQESGIFVCQWCSSILKMYKQQDDILRYHIIKRGNCINNINLSYPILIDGPTINELVSHVLKTFISLKDNKTNNVSIKAYYNDVESMKTDIAKRIEHVITGCKSLPMPVIDVGG